MSKYNVSKILLFVYMILCFRKITCSKYFRFFAGDFISNWCTQNNLTEATAETLRQNGFTYKQAIESLRNEDVHQLALPRAQECLLREIVSSKGKA